MTPGSQTHGPLAHPPLVAMPGRIYWRELRIRVGPPVVFAGVLAAVCLLWRSEVCETREANRSEGSHGDVQGVARHDVPDADAAQHGCDLASGGRKPTPADHPRPEGGVEGTCQGWRTEQPRNLREHPTILSDLMSP